ncbi:MAG TPA: hypothetical protein VGX78_11625 [Pirellulales bacterium]|jgi:hypothetical protein|nr:hypothetical protein [Pirellulales bacterium]
MPIIVGCDRCGKKYGAKETLAGKSLKCPGCGDILKVPAASAATRTANPANAAPNAARPTARSASSQAAPRASATSDGGPLDDLLGIDDPLMSGALLTSAFGAGGLPSSSRPLGKPPQRQAGKSNTLWIVFGASAAVLLIGGIGLVAILLPRSRQNPEAPKAGAVADAARNLPPSPAPSAPGVPQQPTAAGANQPPQQVAAPASLAQGASAAPPSRDPKVWTSDPAFVGQLGPESTFERYAWRLPAGFTAAQAPTLQGPPAPVGRLQGWAWMGPAQLNGLQLGAVVSLLEYNVAPTRVAGDLEQSIKDAFKNFQMSGNRMAVTHGPIEPGRLAGMECVRATFSGSFMGNAVHGLQYICIEGRRVVAINFACAEPPGSAAFSLLEAACLTFHEASPSGASSSGAAAGATPVPGTKP